MNFGKLKTIFTQHYIDSHLSGDNSGKDLYRNFIKTLNESEILKTQFIIYKNIEDKKFKSEISAVEYLKENLSLLGTFDKKQIVSENKKLYSLLKEFKSPYLKEFKLEDERNTLFESLNILTTKDKTVETINEIHNGFEVIKNQLLTDTISINEDSHFVKENINVDKFLETVVTKYNEKYSEISESDKKLIKVLRTGDDTSKESLFKEMVSETILLVNNKLTENKQNIDIREKLLDVKENIFSLKSSTENITKLYNLKKDLSE